MKKWLHTSKTKIINKKKSKKIKTRDTVLESVVSIIINGPTSSSVTLSITGIGLIVFLISAGIACTLSLGNQVLHRLIINKYDKYKKQYEKDQQTFKSLRNLNRKSLQQNLVDKSQYESLCNILLKMWLKRKVNFFMNMNIK